MDSDVWGHYKHNYEIENENSEAVYIINRNAIVFTNRFATVSYNNASYSGSKNMLGYAVDEFMR